MSRAATGDFGGSKPPAAVEGIVSFELSRGSGDWEARGDEPSFDGVGRGETPALAIADYCQKYHNTTTDDCEVDR